MIPTDGAWEAANTMIDVSIKKLGLKKKTLTVLSTKQMNAVRGGQEDGQSSILEPTVSMRSACTDRT
jgi:hypothetical protein